ncbi:glycoside hydrolase family 15 protein [Edaphobacter bradus]|uniref:glycoside hydrolase family 15 protein n=1 Tax=Edaphobacter bradus TaxID=2259016 RepID=UPI0021E04DA1|nr:glycoside hydrolase family 15 protein [Edaphobacter bradus]
MSFQPIENYGVIGNMRSIALVGMDGSIDFLCYPDFDSPTVFVALLDANEGGRFQIQPQLTNMRIRQLYLPDTNILLTRFLAEEGVAELTDYMPIEKDVEQPNEIIRTVSVIRGNVHFKMHCQPRFNYARSAHRTEIAERCATFFPIDDICPPMALYSTVALEQHSEDVISHFDLQAGATATFVLGGLRPRDQPPEMEFVGQRFQQTSGFWKTWIAKSKYKGRWREMVNRSALMLKLLISREHGSLIAAPTFSLPESIGGVRNWDYRFTWLRDATFSLYALIRLGFVEEAEAFIEWLKGRLGDNAERGPLQVMYGIDGRQKLDELTLDHLSGYEGSRPVRIGNAAYQQLQLDIYGEMMDAIYLANKYGDPISYAGWQDVQRILEWLRKNWQRPDEGIWEVRGGGRGFLHSRVMSWVAFDRALRLAQKRSLSGPLDEWQRTRDEIRNDIFTNFWDDRLQSFVQAKGTEDLDASALLMPMMRFISPVDPMWISTLRAIEGRLIEDTLVRRYDVKRTHVDGLPGEEGSFIACSFWYVECLARAGDLERAQLLFEKLLGYANHLGLYSEELGANGQHLGNFPQALTHLALISAATYLDRALSGTGETVWR